jgi:hypothetical protein
VLAHAQIAKKMMGHVHKTDKLDAEGLAILQHLGSLPTVWIAPRETRDERELPLTRMALSKARTALENRMHSTLATPVQSAAEGHRSGQCRRPDTTQPGKPSTSLAFTTESATARATPSPSVPSLTT